MVKVELIQNKGRYLYTNFKPDLSIVKQLKIDVTKIIVVLRPPAYEAHYHNPESEKLFNEIMKMLTENDSTRTIILPRDKKQKHQIDYGIMKLISKTTV